VPFASAVGPAGAVDLEPGPGGDIYWVDIGGGTIDRIVYFPNNRPPTAVIHADQTSGSLPLTVNNVPVFLSAPSGRDVTVKWTTYPYTAVSGDLVPANGTLKFPQGTTRRDVLVTINGGPPNANDITFLIALSSPVYATLGGIGPGLGFATITRS
jgi:hypothetical protein